MSLIDLLPSPLVDDFFRGRWLPIVGAGYSRNAVLPIGASMPGWTQLGHLLAADLQGYEPHSPIDAVSAYEEQFGRPRLVERLMELLHIATAQPGDAHHALCRAGFDLVLTTNFDDLLERAYGAACHPCQLLLTESQLSQGPLQGQAQLLKLHGDLSHPIELVATEDDFDSFLTKRPLMATFAANLLITRTPVLLGYSFDDPDTRSLWALIRDRLGELRRRGYALCVGATPTEVARFGRRGIKVINLSGDDYSVVFAQLFDELRDAYIARFGQFSKATEDEIAAELVLPLSAASRLCYSSVPRDLLAWYRSQVFPVIEEAGYVIVTFEEVLTGITGAGNLVAIIDALLARAQLALIDGSSRSGGFEVDMALFALPPQCVIVVMGMDKAAPLSRALREPLLYQDVQLLVRTTDTIARPELLASQIRAHLAALERKTSQPLELLAQGHFGPAVVVACSLLERALTPRVVLVQPERAPGLLRLLQAARDQGILTKREWKRVENWAGLRNAVVHAGADPDADVSRQAVADITALLTRLEDQNPRAE
jgi:hypothetical protein